MAAALVPAVLEDLWATAQHPCTISCVTRDRQLGQGLSPGGAAGASRHRRLTPTVLAPHPHVSAAAETNSLVSSEVREPHLSLCPAVHTTHPPPAPPWRSPTRRCCHPRTSCALTDSCVRFPAAPPAARPHCRCPSLQTEMPYDYYSMPFCKPPEGLRRSTNTINPGTILLGIRIENSPYNFTIMTKQQGLTVCNGPAYKDHAYPALTDKDVKVRRRRRRRWRWMCLWRWRWRWRWRMV